MTMRYCSLISVLAILSTVCVTAQEEIRVTARLLSVRMIWDEGPHNAFTDLVRWRGRFYCAFREGTGHAEGLGTIRVIVSGEGEAWQSVGVLEREGYDLRDAHLAVTPDDRLMVLGGAAVIEDGRKTGTFVAFTGDGETFGAPIIAVAPGRWLWQVTWHKGKAYGVSYATPDGRPWSSLLVSDDGISWSEHVPELLGKGWPTEATVRFDEDDTLYCLHRRDGEDNSGHLGVAEPPYTDFAWHDLGRYYGGPNFIKIPSGHWIGAGRIIEGEARTVLTLLDVQAGTMTPILELPSGGDTSYPGLVWHDDTLWVSYYSSHEDKTSIYLAKVAIDG